MQNPAMARALGVDTGRIYMLTFSLGAGLAGFSGALLAPTTSIAPFMGQQFVAPAFITVVVGGATNVIAGAVGSSLLLSLDQDAGRLPARRLPRHGGAAAGGAGHHPPDAGRHLGLHPAPARPARPARLRCASGACSPGPRTSASHVWFWLGFAAASVAFLCLSAASSASSTPPTSPITFSTSRWRSGSALLWGYCGVLSFGQVAYFGIAGYVYGIIAGNMAGQRLGPAGRLARRPRRLRAWWRRSSAISSSMPGCRCGSRPILTLVFTLLLETFLGQTAGYQWRVGTVQLGGYNGMTGIPSFQLGQLVFIGLPLLLLRAGRRAGLLPRLPDAGRLARTAGSCSPSARTRCAPSCWATTSAPASSPCSCSRRCSPASPACSTSSGATTSRPRRSACCRRRCR